MAKIHYDARDLRAICELTRVKGFKEAAEALAITPSALSRRVAKLEEAVGGLLVKRTTRSVTLTPLGRRLVARCQPMLNELDDCIEETARMARGMEGQVSVACVPSVSFALLAPVVAGFRRRHPNLRINLKESDGFGIGTAVMNYEVDFGVTTVGDRSKDLHVELVATDPIVLVCARDRPVARKRSVAWGEISEQRLMGYKASSSIRQMIDGSLARAGIELLWFDEVDTLSSLISYLRTGEFVGVVPKLIATHLDDLAMVALSKPRIARKLYLVRRSDVELTPPAQSFWNDVRRSLTSALR